MKAKKDNKQKRNQISAIHTEINSYNNKCQWKNEEKDALTQTRTRTANIIKSHTNKTKQSKNRKSLYSRFVNLFLLFYTMIGILL